MTSISIEYKTFWIRKNVSGTIPEKWDEVSPRQLIAIAKNYLGEASDDNMLSVMCGVRKAIIRKLDLYQKLNLAEQLKFLTDYKPYSHFIISNAGALYAPKPRLQGMTFGQFMFVESFYSSWITSQTDQDLDKFIAALYLPRETPFKSENLAALTLIAERVPALTKCAISINYRLIKEFLSHSYPLIFQKPAPGSKAKLDDGWMKVFESVVGDDIVNQDKYADINIHVMLRYITRKIKEKK
jgi:hypothetical protein